MKKLIQILADISIGIYFIWVAIQLCLLIYFENTLIHKQNFWPFRPMHYEQIQGAADGSITITRLPISSYDVTEFIFYIVFPLVLAFAIIFIIRKKSKKKNYLDNQLSDWNVWFRPNIRYGTTTIILIDISNYTGGNSCSDRS